MDSQLDWVFHPHGLQPPFPHRTKSDSELDPSRRSLGDIDPFPSRASTSAMPLIPLPEPPAPHPLANTYFPPILPSRPRPKPSAKPRLAEILLPNPPLRTSHSLPLLKPPPTPPDDDEDKPTRFRKMKRIGSGLLVKVGLKEDLEWEVVASPADVPGPKPVTVRAEEALKEKRRSTIPWPPSPHAQRRVSSTFGSPRPLSFPSFSSFLNTTSGGNRDSDSAEQSGSSNDHAGPARKESGSGESAMGNYLSSFPYPPTPHVGMFEHGQSEVDPPIPAGHPFSTGASKQTPKQSQTPKMPSAGTWWGQATPSEIPGNASGVPPTPPSSRTPRVPLSPLSHKLRRPSSQSFTRTDSPTAITKRHRNPSLPMPLTPPHSLPPPPSLAELLSLLSTLLLLREVLHIHALSSQRVLDAYRDELPGFVFRDLGRQIDGWWETWRGTLNDYGSRTSSLILSIPSPPAPPTPAPLPSQIPTKPIPPALTQDTLQETIWALEEAGQVPSFTFARMFGRGPGVRVRRMDDEEEREASRRGMREWQDGEWGLLERDRWKEVAVGYGRRGRQQGRKSSSVI
ncbi:hypothetical protein L198_05525 [Cryptococcus wingfieldii CBS 7118]|uniref:Uncharacterized protein n=1 Tax=Cryptococcus wingfieldii CBS 7118 TaxID=1295528 RepID=A0A1E3IYE8_9TREE|nr:hypothetical protein L198_05525 [Cryptococcus wingfieldii CBS 7118]ODN92731.1 hypothetical protein L198_05525 [Cryptococcus wingfieldii CBS 7118]